MGAKGDKFGGYLLDGGEGGYENVLLLSQTWIDIMKIKAICAFKINKPRISFQILYWTVKFELDKKGALRDIVHILLVCHKILDNIEKINLIYNMRK